MNKKEMEREISKIRDDEKEIKAEEALILKKLDFELQKEKIETLKRVSKLKHFTFGDFAQVVIGVTVFSLSPMLSPDIWDYIEAISTEMLLLAHVVIVACFILALNYEFRNSITFDLRFLRRLLKRVFYVHFSTTMTVVLLLVLVKTITWDMSNMLVARNYLAGMSVGLVGAVTFSFLKK